MNGTEGFDPQAFLTVIADLVTTWGLRVVGALVVLMIGRVLAGWTRATVRKLLNRGSVDSTLVPFLSNMVYYLMMAFVVIAVLGLFGIPTASVIAVLGAAGLAVGLALQGTLGNFAAGVMLLLFRPFRVGDSVEVAGTRGGVQEISIFNTVLNSPDNVRITVPNGMVFGQTIKNYSSNETRRVDLVFSIGYGDDIGKAMQIIHNAINSDARVLKDPAPVVAVNELADSSVNLVVRPWVRKENYGALRWDLIRRLKEDLEAGGCSIPFPQRDVHLYRESGQPS
ncbi:MAG: mechanosensitive ion channel [Acidobacteria bacterium]|nr:MAG: mechanosensitive ion channel [Acidobacteriota bacterium]